MRISAEEIDTRPTEIKLHKISRILEVSFDNGQAFHLPCEYLRVFTPSAEALGHAPGQEVLQTGKELVAIESIRPIGAPCYLTKFRDSCRRNSFTYAANRRCSSRPASATD